MGGEPMAQWVRWIYIVICMICIMEVRSGATELEVQLSAPNWVPRGHSATLRCLHQVPSHLLYKVEFMRAGVKIFQYVKDRNPPFTIYPLPGATVNMSLTTQNALVLENLDPSASGLFWCEVSLDTPIFTAASAPHQLIIVYPQKHPPIITFGDPVVMVGGVLRANCTSAPAAPAPKLTWYIDDIKIPEDSVNYYSYRVSSTTRTKGGGGYRQRKHQHQHRLLAPELNTARYWALVSETTTQSPPLNVAKAPKCTLHEHTEEMAKLRDKPRVPPLVPIQLWVSVLELKISAHSKLQLTCVATIPEQVGPGEHFADVKRHTVTVAENELKRPFSDASQGTAARITATSHTSLLLLLHSLLAILLLQA